MNPVEIEEAISELAAQPFDAAEFPFAFIEAFNGKATTIKRLRSGSTNKSDLGGVLRHDHIHIKTCALGEATQTLQALRDSPATKKAKAKFILATDGEELQAEEIKTGDILVCPYKEFPAKFGFFLTLAGISSIPQLKESSFDIKATGLLNKLYLLLKADNPDWDTDERRHDMNHFMARLIFLFFAEDTSILETDGMFTNTVGTMSARDSSDTHEIISELFRAMNAAPEAREAAKLKAWAADFPYVNGGLFEGSTEAPKFSKIARSYLLNIGGQDWTKINPDIFGSMIQAVTDDDERSSLGMHYTSVPNILKVLNPLFLDDLRAKLAEAGDNKRKLKNLRDRMSKIRVFDPACGSGNFLVIAYKEMREIEAKINAYSGEPDRRTAIPLTNFRGIELRDFPAEIARLALIIAEYQCDVTYRGQKDALAEFLPLDSENWITCDNALHLDWVSFMDVEGKGVQFHSDDLFRSPLDQAKIDFESEGGEVFICGNPPYLGSTWQSKEQKEDLKAIFEGRTKSWRSLDYVAGWFMKAADFGNYAECATAFVSTNSICQGQQVPILWPLIFETGHEISFAHTSFKWENLASHNAGVSVAIVAISNRVGAVRKLFALDGSGETVLKEVANINAYLVAAPNVQIAKHQSVKAGATEMLRGNMPYDGGNLLMTASEVDALDFTPNQHKRFIRRIYGSAEFIRGQERYCLWIEDKHLDEAMSIAPVKHRIEAVRTMRLSSRDKGANEMAKRAHQMREMNIGDKQTVAMPCVSSENRGYLPAGLIDNRSTVTNLCFALYDAPLWNMALLASRIHFVWITTVCGQLETRIRYSNTMGWNTFPIPELTEKNKADLRQCAEEILLAREAHFPATIADLYKPDAMPDDLRAAHDRGSVAKFENMGLLAKL